MRSADAMDRADIVARIETNQRLAHQSRNPAIRGLHLEYVRLYRHLLDVRATS
jgi:hypothetical protein